MEIIKNVYDFDVVGPLHYFDCIGAAFICK